jgi:hypothetical protein
VAGNPGETLAIAALSVSVHGQVAYRCAVGLQRDDRIDVVAVALESR